MKYTICGAFAAAQLSQMATNNRLALVSLPLEDASFWLVPMEDRREHGGTRGGILPHLNLASYLRLLDYSSRLLRPGKARVPPEVAEILTRLGSSPELWQQRMEKLRDRTRIFGTVFATKRSEINRLAESRGVKKTQQPERLPQLTRSRCPESARRHSCRRGSNNTCPCGFSLWFFIDSAVFLRSLPKRLARDCLLPVRTGSAHGIGALFKRQRRELNGWPALPLIRMLKTIPLPKSPLRRRPKQVANSSS